ncbi:MAG: translesion error-prone DNA polymerase V autoproteolytic subunit [Bacteroidales bacterium]|nr:translesion error-prone DNA polymerase V autoproteolytic subunit [Bacteroidales bacterium]
MLKEKELTLYTLEQKEVIKLDFIEGGVSAGFPSPCQDYMENSIDLNKELIDHPASTFCARVSGNSMIDEGIEDGDILVVDRSLTPRDGRIVVSFIDGEFTLKKLRLEGNEVWLQPANVNYPAIHITSENNFKIWGVVTYIIKKR